MAETPQERAKAYAAEQVAARRSKSPVTTAASGPDPQAEADWLAGYRAAVEEAARVLDNLLVCNCCCEAVGDAERRVRRLAPPV